MKIAILGSSGMAGHMVYHYLRETDKYDVVGYQKFGGDRAITLPFDHDGLYDMLHEYDIIVNCIGYINFYANQPGMKEDAIYVNAYFPHVLTGLGPKVIHISTDCVFASTLLSQFRKVDDIHDAVDVYGKTKSLGEISVPHLTIRTSIVGPEIRDGHGLFHWCVKNLQESKGIGGYRDVFWNGVTTLALAKFIEKSIDNNECGITHLTSIFPGFNDSGVRMDKDTIIRLFANMMNLDMSLIESIYSPGVGSRLLSCVHGPISFYDMLVDLGVWMRTHKELYLQYRL